MEASMKPKTERDRMAAIKRYCSGEQIAAIARSLGHSRRWVYKWIERYENSDEGSDWHQGRTTAPHSNPHELPQEVVGIVKIIRRSLDGEGLFCGAQAIEWELRELGVEPMPSLRSINRILRREELVQPRTKRYEPKGKKYPALQGDHVNHVHQTDFVGPCYLNGPIRFYSLNSVDLASGRCAISPVLSKAGQNTVDAIWSSWCRLGMPKHQQVDNELVFYGSRKHPRGMGNLIRLCLLNGVEPWFIPMAEPWRNGVIEKFNDHFRMRFLRRVVMHGEEDLRGQSLIFEQKHNTRYRYSKLRGRTPQAALEQSQRKLRFPESAEAPRCPLAKPQTGKYHLVRFIRSNAVLDVFGEKFQLPPEAAYEYAIATIDVANERLQVDIGGMIIDQRRYSLR
jgi:transposase InsO family protein